MTWQDHITIDPHICHGNACIKGTRVMASVVLDNLAAGRSIEEIRDSYPSLTTDDVHAVIAYEGSLSAPR